MAMRARGDLTTSAGELREVCTAGRAATGVQNVDTRAQPEDPQKGVRPSAPTTPWDRMSRRLDWHSPRRPWESSSPTACSSAKPGSCGTAARRSDTRSSSFPVRGGRPGGPPVDVVTGFMGADGETRGRPVGVTVDPRGALIVADDLFKHGVLFLPPTVCSPT